MTRTWTVVGACLIALSVLGSARAQQQAVPNQEFVAFLTSRFRLDERQMAAVKQGLPVIAPLAEAVPREVVMGGVVRIDAPPERTVALVRNIERLESGTGFLHTKRLSDPPRLDDFADLTVSTEDLVALRACKPGHCDVKLGGAAFDTLRTIDWRRPDANAQVQQLARRSAFEYVEAYRHGGNQELAIYRDAERPLFIAQEFADMVKRTSMLPESVPDVADLLLTHPPAPKPASAEEFYYWSEADFGLKPVIRINHVVIQQPSVSHLVPYVIATKQLYANHYFHTGLEIRALVADAERPGRSHFLVVLNMARSDGLTGVFGGVVKSKVRAASRTAMESALRSTKRLAEGR